MPNPLSSSWPHVRCRQTAQNSPRPVAWESSGISKNRLDPGTCAEGLHRGGEQDGFLGDCLQHSKLPGDHRGSECLRQEDWLRPGAGGLRAHLRLAWQQHAGAPHQCECGAGWRVEWVLGWRGAENHAPNSSWLYIIPLPRPPQQMLWFKGWKVERKEGITAG